MKNSLYLQLRESWRLFVKEPEEQRLNVDFASKFPFLVYYENNEVAYAILNNLTFEIEYCSRNYFEMLGIDKKEYEKHGFKSIIEPVVNNQQDYFKLVQNHFESYWQTTPQEKKQDIARTTVGLTYKNKEKGHIRLIMQSYILETNSFNAPTYQFMVFHDVSYMMKDDFYWYRFADLESPDIIFVYHGGTKQILKDDILSIREKEILHLIIEGKNAQEIAAVLFLSKNTVNNHRQNMLNRVGVKDTTGLIMIAKLCQLL